MKNEEELVSSLMDKFNTADPLVLQGIGDDCAVFAGHGDPYLITTDSIVEGSHFLQMEKYDSIVSKLFIRNISDIYAMGGVARFALVNAVIPKADFQDLVIQLEVFAKKYSIGLIGGDSSALSGNSHRYLTMTLIGTVSDGRYYKRSGALQGDGIYLSGPVGLAAAGLYAIEKRIKGYEGLKEHFWRFSLPSEDFIRGFSGRSDIHSAIDISDGLIKDLQRLLHASGKGALLNPDKIIRDSELIELCNENGKNPRDFIFYGGDDYQILFTAEDGYDGPGYRIGDITPASGISLENGEKVDVEGYDHFK